MKLAILVLANTCNIKQLSLSRRWNKHSPFPVFYRSYCGDCKALLEVECIPCCRAGGTGTDWHGKPGMITRLGYAFRSINLDDFTHVLKIDDDTRVNYARLTEWLNKSSGLLKSNLNVFGQCRYAPWERTTFCGGCSVLSHTTLIKQSLMSWPKTGPEDVELSRVQVNLGAKLNNVPGFYEECDKPFESHISLHRCHTAE